MERQHGGIVSRLSRLWDAVFDHQFDHLWYAGVSFEQWKNGFGDFSASDYGFAQSALPKIKGTINGLKFEGKSKRKIGRGCTMADLS